MLEKLSVDELGSFLRALGEYAENTDQVGSAVGEILDGLLSAPGEFDGGSYFDSVEDYESWTELVASPLARRALLVAGLVLDGGYSDAVSTPGVVDYAELLLEDRG